MGDARDAPTTFKELETGGNRFDVIMDHEGVAEAVRNFTVSSLLLANLQQEEILEEQQIESDEDEATSSRNSMVKQRSETLQSLLPNFLRQDVACAEIQDGELVPEAP